MAITGSPVVGSAVSFSESIAAGAGSAQSYTHPASLGTQGGGTTLTVGTGTALSVNAFIDGQLAAGASVTIDLTSFSGVGGTKTLGTRCSGFRISSASTSGVCTVAKGVTNGFVGGAIATTTAWNLDPGGEVFQQAPTTAGWVVGSTTKTVTLDNTAGNGIVSFIFWG